MKATDFEYRHQTLVHQLVVGAAFLNYLIDREDVVGGQLSSGDVSHRADRPSVNER